MKRKDFIESYLKKDEIKNGTLDRNYNISIELSNKEMSFIIEELQLKINNDLEIIFKEDCKRLTKLEIINLFENSNKDYYKNEILLNINIMKFYDYLNERFEINKEKTKIYRIECDAQGIYYYLASIDKELNNEFDFYDIEQPSPFTDEHLPVMCRSNDYINRDLIKYACNSKEQLINWFPKKMIKYIQENAPNAKIVEYEIEDSKVLTSKKQVAFISGTEVRIKELEIEEWFNFENKKKLQNK